MGNAVRWLKLQVSKVDVDLPDMEAQNLVCDAIDTFISERITLSEFVIVHQTANMIEHGETVLTYGYHKLVEKSLRKAKQDGKHIKVVVVDDPFEPLGKELAKALREAGMEVAYSHDMSALRINLLGVTKVILGAEAMFSNGAMYAHTGTADLAIAATDKNIPVLALCETINFTERLSMDSLTYNELDPERCSDAGIRMLFDTTRDKNVTLLVTELGIIPPKSVPAILRKSEEL
jgi:translation initiation factor eIF-2B subunit delta